MYNNHPESNTNYSINDSIYKSKLNFYNSYKILHKDIDEELENNNSYNRYWRHRLIGQLPAMISKER